MGVHRPDDEAAAVQPEHDPILGGAVGRQPHGGHSAGVDLEVVDPARLGGSLAPLLDQLAPLVERQLAPLGENLAPTLVEGPLRGPVADLPSSSLPMRGHRVYYRIDSIAHESMMSIDTSPIDPAADRGGAKLSPVERFWRNRLFARIRHRLTGLQRSSPALTRAHAAAIRLSGGRIRRSFLFTGGMPILVLTTIGRKSGRSRSTPVGFLRHGEAFAVLASNAGNDRSPAWWLNLQATPRAEILANGTRYTVTARRANAEEEATLWNEFATKNPGFDEYRNLTERQIPVVILEPEATNGQPARAVNAV